MRHYLLNYKKPAPVFYIHAVWQFFNRSKGVKSCRNFADACKPILQFIPLQFKTYTIYHTYKNGSCR